jgi:hypothetical protein
MFGLQPGQTLQFAHQVRQHRAHPQRQEVFGATVTGVHGQVARPGLQHPLFVTVLRALGPQALTNGVDTQGNTFGVSVVVVNESKPDRHRAAHAQLESLIRLRQRQRSCLT